MNVAVFSRYFLTRKSICSLLSPLRDVQIVLDSERVLESIDQVRATNPDILLLDSENLNDDVGIVRQVTKIFPLIKIVLLVGVEGAEFELRAIEAGARGCISKRSDLPTLLKALTLVKQGQFWISREVASLVAGKLRSTVTPDHDASRELTEREWEILALLGIGYVNKDIANHLSISENTVKTHLASIYRKLQVNSRLGAVLHYFRRNQQLGSSTANETNPEKARKVTIEAAPEDPNPPPCARNQDLPPKVKPHQA